MLKTIHRADSRGFADHGWLKSRHTFSFADYYEPERMHFGALRVLNDDIVAPGMGFGTHGHSDMEIVSIPLSGSLAHKDSTGTKEIIRSGDVQIMSAGTGVTHSEFNADNSQEVNFLQIWIMPEKKGIPPRYGQRTFDLEARRNSFIKLVSWQEQADVLWINQHAQFWQGLFDAGTKTSLQCENPDSGLYLFVISGTVTAAGEELGKRDAIGISKAETVEIEVRQAARLLAIEVPVD